MKRKEAHHLLLNNGHCVDTIHPQVRLKADLPDDLDVAVGPTSVLDGADPVDHGATLASLGVGDGAVLTCSEPPPEPTVIDVEMSEVDEVSHTPFCCAIFFGFSWYVLCYSVQTTCIVVIVVE